MRLCNPLSQFMDLRELLPLLIRAAAHTCQVDGQQNRVKRDFKHLVNHEDRPKRP